MASAKSYTERIRDAYQHQVYRDALFETLAELTRSPERREKYPQQPAAKLVERLQYRIGRLRDQHGADDAAAVSNRNRAVECH